MQLETYDPGDFYDELFLPTGQPRPEAAPLIKWMQSLQPIELRVNVQFDLAVYNLENMLPTER